MFEITYTCYQRRLRQESGIKWIFGLSGTLQVHRDQSIPPSPPCVEGPPLGITPWSQFPDLLEGLCCLGTLLSTHPAFKNGCAGVDKDVDLTLKCSFCLGCVPYVPSRKQALRWGIHCLSLLCPQCSEPWWPIAVAQKIFLLQKIVLCHVEFPSW